MNHEQPDGFSDRPSIVLFAPRLAGKREWGEEVIIAHSNTYLGKYLRMDAGKAGGLQRHQEKEETFFLYSGAAYVDYDAGDGQLTRMVMSAGMSVHVPPGAVHRVTAISECVFFETSTPHFNDRVRMEAVYGEPEVGGLQSTT